MHLKLINHQCLNISIDIICPSIYKTFNISMNILRNIVDDCQWFIIDVCQCLMNNNNMTIKFVLVLLIVRQILAVGNTTISVSVTDKKINAVTNYTWVISFTDSLNRTYMTFTFPSAVATSSTSVSYVGGTLITPSAIGVNSITIPTANLAIPSSLVVIITNIINPYSALTTNSFFFTTDLETNINVDKIASIIYSPGNLNSCIWSFNKCTQQENSLLTINITTVNPIPSGNQIINIGFPSVWANHNNKNPVYGISSLSCSISFNGGAIISSGITCTKTTNTIIISYSISTVLNASSTITVYLQGVNSPPTVNVTFNTLYTTSTADANGYTIDGIATGSACAIMPVCVTNYSVGTFIPSSLSINTQILTLQTTFTYYTTITFINSDAVQIYYSEPSSLVNCADFRVLRNSVYILTSNSTGSLMSYYFPISTSLPNTDYSYNIQVYLSCTSIILPKSQDPTTFVYKFKRNGDQYLQLTATLTANALPFNSINASLVLSSYQMGSVTTTYTFTFTNGQALSSTPAIVLVFPSDISLNGTTCMMGVNAAATSASCSSTSTSLTINYIGSSIGSGSNITIKVLNVTNPLSPQTRTFGITTYFNSSVNTSRVQYNTAAFNASYTAVTNLPISINPTAFTVYTITSTNISFTTPLIIPLLSTFVLTFPSEVTQITSTSQSLIVNSSFALLTSTPTANGSKLTFYNAQDIPLGSNLIIALSLRSPTYVNTFSYVQLVVSKNNATYIQSLNSMTVPVTQTGVMPVTILPIDSITGATSSYQLTLTLSIPHPQPFTTIVNVGSDTKLITVGTACAGSCSAVTIIGNSSFSFSVTNPSPNSTSPINMVFNISSFVNSRNIGTGFLWNISTQTSATNPISFQSASPVISVPNLLTAVFQAGDYYRSNNNTVKLKLNFSNLLQSTDYLLFSMDKTTYDVYSNISCSPIYGDCSLYNATTANVLVIKIIPNSSKIFANPLQLWIEGLISGANTNYMQTDYITIGSYSSNDYMIDQGKLIYSIGCSDDLSLPNTCRTCTSSGTCLSCYVAQGYYLNGSTCVTSCGGATNYFSYGNSTTGTCQSCTTATNGCKTCSSQTICITCLNSSYYLYTSTSNCSLFCSNTSGYVSTYQSGFLVCVPCADSNCLVCTNISYGSCTQCSITSILVLGICSNNCPSQSYYVLYANCVACDPACYTCLSGGDRDCIICSVGYFNNSGVCGTTCPVGTAKITTNGTCGCYPTCASCDSNNYASCTACLNFSLLLYNGQCIASCPTSTYITTNSCIACSSGCLNCSSNVCFTCSAGLYMYNSQCYGNCNFISQQYDALNSTCVLCPSGCDTCSNGICNTCLPDYTYSSASCIETCLLTNSCQVDTSKVIPLPGCLTIVIWCIIVLILRYASHQNYVPYSMILLSSLVEFCLILATLSQTSSKVVISRLLTIDLMSKNVILILLGFTLALNYITNFIYLYIFYKYLKPLVNNPKQIDVITNTVTLVIAVLTNYRFAIVAFSKMFPKPRIHIQMAKYLTPVHYISFVSLIISIFPLVACTILLGKQQKLTNLYMLALDLMILIIFNAVITIWFISSKKDDKYFDDEVKKEYASEDVNVTKENIKEKQEKDNSNVNMIVTLQNSQKDSHESDQYDFGESYKKFQAKKTQIKANNNTNNNTNNNSNNNTSDPILIDDLPEQSTIQKRLKKSQRNIFAIQNQYEPEPQQPHKADINYEDTILSRRNKNVRQNNINSRAYPKDNINNNKMSRATTINRNAPTRQDKRYNQSRQMDLDSQKFDKQINYIQQKQMGIKQMSDIENQSYIDIEDSFNKMNSHVSQINFQPKQKIPKPKRLHGNSTAMQNKKNPKDTNNNNQTSMRKMPNKRYFESDATFDQKQKDDFESIIKQKVQQSSIRKSKNISVLTHEQNDLEQISPSYYNFQNQRFHLQDIEASSSKS